MGPGLSDRDKERFAELRSKLDGITRPERESSTLDGAPGPLDPMLASTFEGVLADLDESDWIAEQKYDGTRIILEKFNGQVSLYTRRHVERSALLTELTETAQAVLPDGCILDGEYTYFTPDGVSRFVPIHAAGDKIAEEDLSEQFLVFDILAQAGEWCTREELLERKARLQEIVPPEGILQPVDYESREFQVYFDELVASGEEGIIIKRRNSAYHRDTRSDHWQKVKAFTETDVIAVGYTPGEGRRSETFGALVMTDGDQYRGRVGSGFDETELTALLEQMEPIEKRPVSEDKVGMAYTPVEPFVIQVKYQEVTDAGELRAPVFLRMRPDKPLTDVESLSPVSDR